MHVLTHHGANGYLFNHVCSPNYIYQRYTLVTDLRTFERIKFDDVWGEWQLITSDLRKMPITFLNGWGSNGLSEVFKKDGVVHMLISIRNRK